MKGVSSEDNLLQYFRPSADRIDPHKLNHKIKSIKAALKLAERHNEDLHLKIKTMKESHHLETMHLEHQLRRYKDRYETLTENYEIRGLELKQCRKKLKRAEVTQAFNAGTHLTIDEAEETIIKQQKQIGRLREESRLLYQQLYERSARLKDLQQMFSKGKHDQKDKAFLANLRNALQTKNEEFQKIIQEKASLSFSKNSLEKQNSQLNIKLARLVAQLDFERKGQADFKQKLQKQERQYRQLKEQNRNISNKYSELLTFSYELQRDFERDITAMSRQINRKQHRQ